MPDKLLSELTPGDIELARRAVEDTLIEFRDSRLSTLRNNGLVIREADGQDSSIIRLSIEDALHVAIKAVLGYDGDRMEPS